MGRRSQTGSAASYQNALSEHADEAYFELHDGTLASQDHGPNHQPSPRQRIAELMFRCLAERGPSGQYIRRPARVREIAEVAGCSVNDVIEVVEVFRREDRSFLMPPVGVALTAETMIDISHEALIRQWQRFGGANDRTNENESTGSWLEQEELSRQRYRRLVEAAENETIAGLLHDPELGFLNKWWQAFQPTPAWADICRKDSFKLASSFLTRSLENDAQQKAALERERSERIVAAEAIAKKMKLRFDIITYVGTLVLIVGAIAIWQTLVARRATKRADEKALAATIAETESERQKLAAQKEALASKLATESSERFRKRAEWLVYANTLASAQREWESGNAQLAWNYLDSAQWNLRGWEHDYLYSTFNRGHKTLVDTAAVSSVAITTDGKQIVSGSEDNTVKVWRFVGRR